MNSSKINKLPVFPLGLVVLPGTIQTLQIFEPRYLSMVKNCMSSGTGFVITLSKSNQSGESFMSQGTFVEIIDFNQLPNGLLGITVRGSQKVSIKSVEQLESGLHYASISPIAEPVVDDQQNVAAGRIVTIGRQGAQAGQDGAVAVDHDYRLGLHQREPQTDGRREAHRARHVEIRRLVIDCMQLLAGDADVADNELVTQNRRDLSQDFGRDHSP